MITINTFSIYIVSLIKVSVWYVYKLRVVSLIKVSMLYVYKLHVIVFHLLRFLGKLRRYFRSQPLFTQLGYDLTFDITFCLSHIPVLCRLMVVVYLVLSKYNL